MPQSKRLLLITVLGMSLALGACGQVGPTRSPTSLATAVVPSSATISSAAPSQSITVAPSVASAPPAKPPLVAGSNRVGAIRSDLRLPSPRSRAVAYELGSSILVIGGLTDTGTTTGSILALDVGSRHVTTLGALAAPVHDAGGAVLGRSGFVFGGGRIAPGSVVQRVDSTGRAVTVGHLPAVRADLASVTIGGRLLVVGGGTAAGPDARVLATTDGRRFQTIATLLVGVRYPAVAVLGGLVYVIGGSTSKGDTRVIQTIDPRTGVVRIVSKMAHGLSHASGFVLGQELLFAGGRTRDVAQDGLWRLSVADGAVTRIGRLPYAVSDAAAIVSHGVAYLIGGEAHRPLGTIIEVSTK